MKMSAKYFNQFFSKASFAYKITYNSEFTLKLDTRENSIFLKQTTGKGSV